MLIFFSYKIIYEINNEDYAKDSIYLQNIINRKSINKITTTLTPVVRV